MRRFLPLLVLGLCACAENSNIDSTVTTTDSLGTVQGTVFDESETTSGSVLIALADMSDGTPFVMHSVSVDASELPYDYLFTGVDPEVEYELVVFVDAGEASDLLAIGDEDRLEVANDTVRASIDGRKRISGINYAL